MDLRDYIPLRRGYPLQPARQERVILFFAIAICMLVVSALECDLSVVLSLTAVLQGAPLLASQPSNDSFGR